VTLEEHCSRLLRRLESRLGSGRGIEAELAAAVASRQHLEALRNEVADLCQFATEPGFEAQVLADVKRIEAAVDEMDAAAFFRKPKPQSPDLPELPDPNAYLSHHLVWRLRCIDLDHPKCWADHEDAATLREILKKLGALEQYTWRELAALSDHNHDWEDTSRWVKSAQSRLEELNLDDQSGWFQLALDRRGRVFGFRNGYTFSIVWWDRDHEVYETHQKVASNR
jgi:hypothetical protein